MKLGSVSYEPQIEIDVAQPFEMFSHESWDVAFRIKLGDVWYGPFDNFNHAQHTLQTYLAAALVSQPEGKSA